MGTPSGKIGRLPEELRNQVNQMLVDNKEASEIIALLDAKGFPGVSPQNVSAWKSFGFQKWLKRRERLEDSRDRMEFARNLVKEAGREGMVAASDAARQLVVEGIIGAMEDFDPHALSDLIKEKPATIVGISLALSKLSGSDQSSLLLSRKLTEIEDRIKGKVEEGGAVTTDDLKDILREHYGIGK